MTGLIILAAVVVAIRVLFWRQDAARQRRKRDALASFHKVDP